LVAGAGFEPTTFGL